MIQANNISFKPMLLMLCFFLQGFYAQTDTITTRTFIRDPDFIVSAGRVFKLGFFSPENSTNRYLAIYYNVSENTVIWIANRDNPLVDDTSGTVTISNDGNLILINGQNETIWSTRINNSVPVNTSVQIQDTGNLILRDVSTHNVLWDCFSHPSSTFMPGMRLYENMPMTSWKSPPDPGVGNFTSDIRVTDLNLVQVFIWENGRVHYRSGPWNGNIFIGIKEQYRAYSSIRVENDSGGIYVTAPEVSFLMKLDLDLSGSLMQTLWDERSRRWQVIWTSVQNECDVYGWCGPFGVCNPMDSPICSCLRGFEPANRDEWRSGNWTSGCTRRTELRCAEDQNTDNVFLRMPYVKVPNFAERFPGGVEVECRIMCLRNCSCLAYSHDTNLGCMLWMETLVDIQQFHGVGADLHIRLASSELDNNNDRNLVVIIIPVVAGFALLSISIFIAWCWMAKKKRKRIEEQKGLETQQLDSNNIVLKDETEKINITELPLFTVKTLADATNQFHEDNMLGRGGFGRVYKGRLENGKEIAVKRLSTTSGQGAEEFRNETIVISRVQHRNLVRLLGCCIEREEKMLVYEYMTNTSLDDCLFDKHPSHKVLDWKKRFSIVEGIARGLLYLHMDSRLKIIHRDLKPSNVLLDDDYTPKISDFGIARIFGGNQEQDNTVRVVGTYGYMAPEYAVDGLFSEKSDVYSFGVLMLEIVSGKKNTQYYNQEWSLSLIGCAWKLWNEDNCMVFSDETIADLSFEAEIVRCIQIGLLCVQEFPKDRPSVQTVLSMLNLEIEELPLPEKPVFAEKWNNSHVESSQPTRQTRCSVNELTITALDGR